MNKKPNRPIYLTPKEKEDLNDTLSEVKKPKIDSFLNRSIE